MGLAIQATFHLHLVYLVVIWDHYAAGMGQRPRQFGDGPWIYRSPAITSPTLRVWLGVRDAATVDAEMTVADILACGVNVVRAKPMR